jgi:hypothetical protein
MPAVKTEESRLRAMRAGKRYTRPSKIPANTVLDQPEIPFVWRVVTENERADAVQSAHEYLGRRHVPIVVPGQSYLEDETAWQVLWHAMRDPDNPDRPLARDVDELREFVSAEERDALITEYLDVEEFVNPDLRGLSGDERAALIEALKKNDTRTGLSFGSVALWSFLRTMDGQPWSSPTAKS